MMHLLAAALAAPLPPLEPWANGSLARFKQIDPTDYGPDISVDASGAYYDVSGDTLWVVRGGTAPGKSTDKLWEIKHPNQPTQVITFHPLPIGDFEGVTGAGDELYLLNEKGQDGSPSIQVLHRNGSSWTAGGIWTLPATPVKHHGPEGITFIPDGHYDALIRGPSAKHGGSRSANR